MPQRDIEAARLRSKARAALFGGPGELTVGRYVLGKVLGRGGLGVVHQARDPELDRDVALKVVRPEAGVPALLVAEARAIARLSHPNVVEIFDTGRIGDEVFIAMELVDGQTLDEWLSPGRSWDEIRDVLLQAGRGLAHAHAAGLVHRDFKPGNVMVGSDGRVRVLDFGLAKAVRGPEPAALGDAVAGTPAYMAPEQLFGRDVDARADQFAFCVVAFEALHGRRPFAGRTLPAIVAALERGVVEAPAAGLAPPAIEAAVRRGLAIDPDGRWPTMDALLTEVERHRRRRWPVAVGLGALALGIGVGVGVGLGASTRDTTCPELAPAVEDAWGNERAAAARDAFVGTGVSYAPATWSAVSTSLDAYRDEWSAAYAEVCGDPVEAELERLSARVRCLEHRLATLRAYVSLLEHADRRLVSEAVRGVERLPSIEVCVVSERLESSFPPAQNARQIATFTRIEERLAEAASHNFANRPEEARVAAEEALAQAEQVGSAPLSAAAVFQLGASARGRADFDASAEHLTAAFWMAMASHTDRVAVDAAITLVELHGHDLARFDDAERWARQARSLLERSPDAVQAEVGLPAALAKMALVRRRYDEASELLGGAIEAEEPGTVVQGFLISMRASALEANNRFDGARKHYEEARAILTSRLGDGHPEVGNVRVNLGVLLHRMGEFDDAIAELRAGIATLDASLPNHAMTGMGHNNFALALQQQGHDDEAAQQFEAALAIMKDAMPPTHPYIGMLVGNVGIAAGKQGRTEEAREHIGRALVILSEAMGPEDPIAAELTLAWGDLERDEGNAELAAELYERTLELVDDVPGHAATRASAEFGLARVLLALSTVERARRHAVAAKKILADVAEDKTTAQLRAEVERWLARIG